MVVYRVELCAMVDARMLDVYVGVTCDCDGVRYKLDVCV